MKISTIEKANRIDIQLESCKYAILQLKNDPEAILDELPRSILKDVATYTKGLLKEKIKQLDKEYKALIDPVVHLRCRGILTRIEQIERDIKLLNALNQFPTYYDMKRLGDEFVTLLNQLSWPEAKEKHLQELKNVLEWLKSEFKYL